MQEMKSIDIIRPQAELANKDLIYFGIKEHLNGFLLKIYLTQKHFLFC